MITLSKPIPSEAPAASVETLAEHVPATSIDSIKEEPHPFTETHRAQLVSTARELRKSSYELHYSAVEGKLENLLKRARNLDQRAEKLISDTIPKNTQETRLAVEEEVTPEPETTSYFGSLWNKCTWSNLTNVVNRKTITIAAVALTTLAVGYAASQICEDPCVQHYGGVVGYLNADAKMYSQDGACHFIS